MAPRKRVPPCPFAVSRPSSSLAEAGSSSASQRQPYSQKFYLGGHFSATMCAVSKPEMICGSDRLANRETGTSLEHRSQREECMVSLQFNCTIDELRSL